MFKEKRKGNVGIRVYSPNELSLRGHAYIIRYDGEVEKEKALHSDPWQLENRDSEIVKEFWAPEQPPSLDRELLEFWKGVNPEAFKKSCIDRLNGSNVNWS